MTGANASKWLTVEEMKEKIEKVFGGDTRGDVPDLADLTAGTFEWFCEIFAHSDRMEQREAQKNSFRSAEEKNDEPETAQEATLKS